MRKFDPSRTYYRPERMTIGMIGVTHEQAIQLSQKYFQFPKLLPPPTIVRSPPQFQTAEFRQESTPPEKKVFL